MHTFVVRSFIAVSAFTSALACSSMVEHREGQTQPHGSTVEHSAEEPQATPEELSSEQMPTDGQPSLPDTSTTRQPSNDTPDTSGASATAQETELKVPRGTEKMRAKKEAFAEHLTVGSAHALPEPQTTMPFTSGALDSLASPTGRAGGGLKASGRGASMGQRRGKMKMMSSRQPAKMHVGHLSQPPMNREGYQHHAESEFADPLETPFSTFSTDVDTASYTNARRYLQNGNLPVPSSIRIEEFLNYFQYEPIAKDASHPVAVGTSWAPCPWNPNNYLLQVRVETETIHPADLPPLNLVYLIDTSGSMRRELPLLVDGLLMLTENLRAEDTVSIVTYAGHSGITLQPTRGNQKASIQAALRSLHAGGSTAGADGIRTAYSLAKQRFERGAMNRVILATDGDFNVGISDQGSLVRLIEKERESGVFLSVLGFGRGNYQDHHLESLADHGNGQYSYIDSKLEAHRVLVQRAGGTLNTIAKDVKLRLEFNPDHVGEYRLIGYDNRRLTTRQFDDDKKDAGDIGAGHMVTALYEVKPRTMAQRSTTRPLRYQASRPVSPVYTQEWLTAELRYKLPQGSRSTDDPSYTRPINQRDSRPRLGPSFFTRRVRASPQKL